MSEIYVSNRSELLSALSKASGGDTILLESGNYGDVDLSGLNFNNYVTITSADGNQGATFSGIEMENASYLRLDNIHVNSPSDGEAIGINDSHHIDILNSEINGPITQPGTPIFDVNFGIEVRDSSSHIRAINNDIHHVAVGIGNYGTKEFELSENTLNYLGSDAFKFAGVQHGVITNNTGPTHFYPYEDTHADFMQFQGAPSSHLEITGNVLLLQNRFDMQGLFFGGQGGHNNLHIENNIIYTQMANGISIHEGGANITILHNTLVNALSDERPVTAIKAPSTATVEYNIHSLKNGELSGKNIVTQHKEPNEDFHFSDLFVNAHTSKGITLEDLRPVEGSLAETYGAIDRLNELLDGTSGTTPPPEPTPEPEPTPDPEPEPQPEPDSGTGDSSNSNDDASIVPEAPAGTAFAMMGALEVSGAGDVAEYAHSGDMALSSATLAFSFNADAVSGTRGLVSKDAAGDGDHFTSYIKKGVLYIRFQDGDSTETISVKDIKANTDYDVQIAVGEGGASVWLNGALVGAASTDIDLSQNTEYLQIGANGWASDAGEDGFRHTFDGTISDVVLVEGLKTPEEMDAILAGEAPSSGNDQDTPVVDEPPVYANSVFSMEGDNEFFGFTKDIVNVAHKSAYELSEGTISFSFNADSVSGRQGLMSKDASGYQGGGDHFSAWIHKGTLYVRFQDGENDALFKVDNIKANQEYEVTAYFQQGEVGVYLDGELLGTEVLSMDWTDNAEYLQVGGLGWASDTGDDAVRDAFDGTISDVAIFDEVYTPVEVDMIV